MTELDISVSLGPVRAIPVPVIAADQQIIAAPCRLVGWSLREPSSTGPQEQEGSVTSPGALATICQLTLLGRGTYNVQWEVALGGTVAAGDANNFRITNGGAQSLVSVNPGAVGTYPQVPIEMSVGPLGGITIQAIAAGTVGAIYQAQFSITPATIDDAIVEIQDGNQPLGEISLGAGQAETRFLSEGGIICNQQILLHIIQGAVTGVIFARYYQ